MHISEKSSNFAAAFGKKVAHKMIQLDGINKHYGKQHVLQDIHLSIHSGEVIGLLGENGAGKSTLMKILVGLVAADDEKEGHPYAERIGYLPEQNPLYTDMYVREYLAFAGRIGRGNAATIEELIERVGLTREANKKIGQLSKGYRQRVGLAQALMGDPQLLILDEPTTGLDPKQLVEIRALIKKVGEGCTVILSTHILQEVKEMCDRVIILRHGRIVVDKPIGEIDDLEGLFSGESPETTGESPETTTTI